MGHYTAERSEVIRSGFRLSRTELTMEHCPNYGGELKIIAAIHKDCNQSQS
jgi:hypothetical protein